MPLSLTVAVLLLMPSSFYPPTLSTISWSSLLSCEQSLCFTICIPTHTTYLLKTCLTYAHAFAFTIPTTLSPISKLMNTSFCSLFATKWTTSFTYFHCLQGCSLPWSSSHLHSCISPTSPKPTLLHSLLQTTNASN